MILKNHRLANMSKTPVIASRMTISNKKDKKKLKSMNKKVKMYLNRTKNIPKQ